MHPDRADHFSEPTIARPTPPLPTRGDTVSFRQFTLGWSDLRRLMKADEQDSAMPGATFTAARVAATAGGQYVGVCVPAIQTADLAMAWEEEVQGETVARNYVF